MRSIAGRLDVAGRMRELQRKAGAPGDYSTPTTAVFVYTTLSIG